MNRKSPAGRNAESAPRGVTFSGESGCSHGESVVVGRCPLNKFLIPDGGCPRCAAARFWLTGLFHAPAQR